jgi:hypothetical protein
VNDGAEPQELESKPSPSDLAPPPRQEAPRQSGQVDDADDLRSFHLNRLLRKRLTQTLVAILVIAAAILGAILGGPAAALIAGGGAVLLSVLIVFFIADAASEDAFFDIYAQQRGMTRTEDGSLPPVTPLLRKGDEREADEVLTGSLAEGLDGTLALYTYTDVYHDKDGRHETDYHFTISMANLPDCVQFVPELYCNRKSGFRFMESIEDVFRTKERLHLESEALEEHYEIFVSKQQDQNWIRQLFSPTFIVWLTDSAPEKFAFELESGVLCCNVKGHQKDAKHLDSMRDAVASVARRIREEVGEWLPAGPPG